MWDDPSARVLACTIAGIGRDEADLHVILNMSDQMIEAETPELPDRLWHVAVDTARHHPAICWSLRARFRCRGESSASLPAA